MKSGFTLSEVLVTLGIIGVVSAMTIPTLMRNHQRQVYVIQLKKAYSTILQGVETYVNDRRAVNLLETPIRNNAENLNKFFHDYFKVVQDCHGS